MGVPPLGEYKNTTSKRAKSITKSRITLISIYYTLQKGAAIGRGDNPLAVNKYYITLHLIKGRRTGGIVCSATDSL
jgi:hypothetical protein